MKLDSQNKRDGLDLLKHLPANSIQLAFFDPQYREGLDKLNYGNEGARMSERAALPQMDNSLISQFMDELYRVLEPSAHLMLWCDKFTLVEGVWKKWAVDTGFEAVDMITWNKMKMGMGYRSRRTSEHLLVLQKPPKCAKACWTKHDILDVWTEQAPAGGHPHAKPEQLIGQLIEATTHPGDLVLDPAAGGYGVMRAAVALDRTFIGCDLLG